MKLSPRQRQVLALLRSGHTYTQAAQQLGLKKGTLSSLMNKAVRKNGFRSNTDLRKAVQFMPLDKPPAIKRKVRGVYPTRSGTYKAVLCANKVLYWLGTYRAEEAAIAARLEGERKYRGTTTQSGN